MRGQLRSDPVVVPGSPRSRGSSISSSVHSPTTGRSSTIAAIPFSTSPLPAYVAAPSASESVQNAVAERPLSEDIGPVVFSDVALAQINSFLDTLLYNFLAHSRSSTLARVKPSVDTVIKGGLGQRAIASGEQELEDLLGDGDDDDELDLEEKERDTASAWDLDFTFRRTRLRLMVYMSLATMDDDEEERYVEENNLKSQPGDESERASPRSGLVSWKALMFLTAVLEYVAEQCLKDAGQFAYARASVSRANDDNNTSTTGSVVTAPDDRLIVSDADVRKLNLSPSLGRLWRSWKKATATSPRLSQHPWQSTATPRRTSNISSTAVEDAVAERQRRAIDALGVTTDTIAYELPRRPNSDQTPRRHSPLDNPKRSRSFVRLPLAIAPSNGSGSWQRSAAAEPVSDHRPRHVRSSSLPPPRLSIFGLPSRARPDDTHLSASATDVSKKREAVILGHSPSTDEAPKSDGTKSEEQKEAAAQDSAAVPESAGETDATAVETAEKEPAHAAKLEAPAEAPIYEQGTATPIESIPEEEVLPSPEEDKAGAVTEAQDVPEAKSQGDEIQVPPVPVVVAPPPPPAPRIDEDEYDPFRADLPGPSARKDYKSVASNNPRGSISPTPSPEPQTLTKAEAPRDEPSLPSEQRENNHASEIDAIGIAVGSPTIAAAMATAAAQSRKREKPSPIKVPSSKGSTPQSATQAPAAPKTVAVAPSHTGLGIGSDIVSPLRMSPVQVADYQPPSSALTSDDNKTSDVFVTPPRSPTGAHEQFETSVAQPVPDPSQSPSAQPKPSGVQPSALPNEGQATSSQRTKAETSVAQLTRAFDDTAANRQTDKHVPPPAKPAEVQPQTNFSQRRQEAAGSATAPTDSGLATKPAKTTAPSAHSPAAVAAAAAAAASTVTAASINQVDTAPKRSSTVSGAKESPTTSEKGYIPQSPRWSTPPQLTPKSSKSGLMARDARVQTENTSELADYLRSTAPNRPPPTPKPFVPSSQTAATDAAANTVNGGQMKAMSSTGSFKSKPRGAASMLIEPRTMRVERQANDELIAFLNEGPPGARVSKARSTETTNSTANYGASPANRSASLISHAPSVNESINSHSALIGRRTGSNPALSSDSQRSPAQVPARQPAAPLPKQMGGAPVRKQRRVKDPYALDMDDEEDEGDDILMGLPNKREEQGMSMIDFLRSSEPPSRSGSTGGNSKSKATSGSAQYSNGGASRASASSPALPDFLRDGSRGPSARSSRESFGDGWKGDKSRRNSQRSTEGKRRFSFFKKIAA